MLTGFVLQLIKMTSNQYRISNTERNGSGGSGTHDLSQLSTLLSTTYLNGQPLWYTFGLKSWKIEMHNYIKEYWWIN